MLKKKSLSKQPSFLSIGGSIFAMFFGAGNIIFPLYLGINYCQNPIMSSLGILVSAVLVPLLGLIGILLYYGDYQKFFSTLGKIPSTCLIITILLLLGPFGGIPRAIAVSYSTLKTLFAFQQAPLPSLPVFSFVSCVLIYLFSCKLGKIIQWLGYVFSPLIFISLGWIIIQGLFTTQPSKCSAPLQCKDAFIHGFVEGFNTMDLLASFFFCSIVLTSIKKMISSEHMEDSSDELEFKKIGKKTKKVLLKGFILACFLLGLVYIGFAFCSSRHANMLIGVPRSEILGKISYIVLGNNAIIPGIGVFTACLTTEIALVGIFADFISRFIKFCKISYSNAVIITLVPTYLISILNFDKITILLVPILKLCYPAIIALTIGNICFKLWKFKHRKILFYSVLTVTILLEVLSSALSSY